MAELVRVTSVTKVYQEGGVGALNGVSLSIHEGEFAAIMGPSGSGKSTLLNLIAGLDRPSSGDLVVAGKELNTLGETELARFRLDAIGFVFQFFHLLPSLTAFENVVIPAHLAGTPNGDERARRLLTRLGIEEVADRYPARLSGGQQQGVALARALVNSPKLVLADEPTGALDTRSGEQVMGLLAELNRKGQTVVLVTHDPKLAAHYATRVISIIDGRVIDDARLESNELSAGEVISVRLDEEAAS
jgi:putative ABC transport system ATP-binding protein